MKLNFKNEPMKNQSASIKSVSLIRRFASGLALALGLAFSASQAQGQSPQTFSTAGNQTWTCPAGVYEVQVEATGGGGGGGGVGANYDCGGGGAGGSYVRYTVNVTPNTVYKLTVGAAGTAGAGGAAGTGATGGTGGSSFFGNSAAGNGSDASVLAVGGPGGLLDNTTGTSSSYKGSSGGTATITGNLPSSGAAANTTGTSGGIGAPTQNKASGAGGAGAGYSGSSGGGAGGASQTSAGNGNDGTAPGGGGSGGVQVTATTNGKGGKGGVGQVVLTWTAGTAPTVTSSGASSITASTATLNGNVTSDGNAPITERGFVYNTSSGVTIGGSGVTKTTVAGTTGSYTLNLSSLTGGTTYYFKAYAINAVGTTYSSPESSFSTSGTTPPTLTAAGSATVDAPFTVTFTDDATWRTAITSITVGGVALSGSAYSVSAGQITFTPANDSLLQSAGSKSIVVNASTYSSDPVTQNIGAGAATKLVFSTVPSSVFVGVAFSATVQAQDQYGNLATGSSASVTVSKASGTGTLTGGAAQNLSGGQITFGSLSYDTAETFTIQATAGGLTTATSGNISATWQNATDDVWQNSGTAWLTTTHWSLGTVPTSAQVAQFALTGTTTVGISMSGTTPVGSQSVGGIEAASGNAAALTVNNSSSTTAGILTVAGVVINGQPNVILRNNSGSAMTIADGSGSGTMGLALGNATENIINLDGSGGITISDIISSSSGTTPLTFGGSSGASGVIAITGTANTFTGTVKLTGPEVDFSGDGSFGNSANNIVINGGRLGIPSGGTVTIAFGRTIYLGSTAGTSISAKGSAGVLTYNGVITDLTSSGILVKQGAGTLALGGASTYTGNTTNNNGTIQLTTGNNRLPTGTIFAIGGGANTCVLDLNGNNQQLAGLYSQSATTNLTFIKSTSAATLTIAGNGSFGVGTPGVISGALGLTMNGGGSTLTLGDTNNFTGNTTITAGTLALSGSGSIANSPTIAIAGGATFDVTGLTTALTLASGQGITASGTASAGTIAVSATKGLTTAANSPLKFTAFNGSTAPLTLSGAGTLALQGGNPVTVTIANGGTPLGVADYKLIAKGASGTVSGTPSSVTVMGDGVAGTASLVNTGGELYLRVVPGPSILISPSSRSFGAVAVNGTSVLTYAVSGGNLTDPNGITINAPTGFGVSINNAGPFTGSLMLTADGSGTVASTTIYVQFNPTMQQSYPGNVANTSSGATEQDVAVTGTGALSPSVTTRAANPTNTTSATLNGTVTFNNGAAITDRGFYYQTTAGVTTSGTKVDEGGTTVADYSKAITAGTLSPNTVYYYRAYAVNAIGTTLDSSDTSFTTLAATPTAPTVGSPTASSLQVTIGSGDGNPAATTYAIQETGSSKYVQADGSLNTMAVYQTPATWNPSGAAITVTGLNPGATYTFQVIAKNGAGVATAFGPTASANTANTSFTTGNIAVLSADSASANNTTFSIVELNPTTAGQSPVQTFHIDGTVNDGPGGTAGDVLRTSGSATSAPKLNDSSDGAYLVFAGFNTNNSVGSVNTNLQRGVGTLNASGTYTLQTTYNGTSGNPVRGATTVDDNTWFINEGTSGIYSNTTANVSSPSSATLTLSGTYASLKTFGGITYALNKSASVPVVETLSADGTTLTTLPGLTTTYDNNAVDFYMISSGNNGTYDTLYVLDETSATAGAINKFSLVGGSWTANGSYTTSFGGYGLCAAQSGGGAVLYATTGSGATALNSVIKLTDTAGYNSAIAITTANNTTLYTAATGATLKGVAFAPKVAQTITFGSLATATYGDADFSLGATASSGLTVSYTSSDPTVATVSGATVHVLKAGSTIITASQLGNATYAAATSVVQGLTVNAGVSAPNLNYTNAPEQARFITLVDIQAAGLSSSQGSPSYAITGVNSPISAAGTVIFNSGNIKYTYPTSDSPVSDSFSYTVSDGTSSRTATVSITFTNVAGPQITPTLDGANHPVIGFHGLPGYSYHIQRATTLANGGDWTPVQAVSLPSDGDGSYSWTDTDKTVPPDNVYYRLSYP